MAWSTIRGHDAIVSRFRTAIELGRLAHAYLFVGPPGIGKRRVAIELAKALLCANPPAAVTACDVCPDCKLVAAGTHPDFTITRTPEDKHEFPIEVMHEFLSALALKPSRGNRKIGLIEDADNLNEESANAFLKTLEEPPAGSLLILRARSAETLLSTIRSRTQAINFRPLNDSDLRAVLTTQGIAPDRIGPLLPRAQGSAGRALALNDPALGDFRRELIEALAAEPFHPAAIAERWTPFLEAASKDSAGQRQRAALSIELLMDLLRDALRLALNAPPRDAGNQQLAVMAKRLGPDRVIHLLESCLDAERHVDMRVPLPITVELLVDRLAAA